MIKKNQVFIKVEPVEQSTLQSDLWFELMWTSKVYLYVNFWSHEPHSKALIPWWISLICLCRTSFRLQIFLHDSHWCRDLLFWWTLLTCRFKPVFHLNDLLQESHVKGLWTFIRLCDVSTCLFNWLLVPKFLLQMSQWKILLFLKFTTVSSWL